MIGSVDACHAHERVTPPHGNSAPLPDTVTL